MWVGARVSLQNYGSKGSPPWFVARAVLPYVPSPLPDQTPQALSIVLNFAAHKSNITDCFFDISRSIFCYFDLYHICRCQNKRMSFRLYLISRGT